MLHRSAVLGVAPLNTAHSLLPSMRTLHIHMLHRSIFVYPRTTIYLSIKAGHLAGPEMENSDEKDNPRRFCLSEPWHGHRFRTGLASWFRAAGLRITRVPQTAIPNRDDFFGALRPFEE
jgi:hypothetical protein